MVYNHDFVDRHFHQTTELKGVFTLGLTAWPGTRPRKPDVAVAKNYLNEKELGI